MRQLRSELVHTMNENALEILGIGGQQSDYREGRINKETDPGFIHLREGNRFLGTGDRYLCSDQIARVRGSLFNRFTFTSNIKLGTSCCNCWSRVN
jgi:hypothetical protein